MEISHISLFSCFKTCTRNQCDVTKWGKTNRVKQVCNSSFSDFYMRAKTF